MYNKEKGKPLVGFEHVPLTYCRLGLGGPKFIIYHHLNMFHEFLNDMMNINNLEKD
jgi:hypothetical protein